MEGVKLDLKDKKILFELDFHAREPNAKIAKKVRLSKGCWLSLKKITEGKSNLGLSADY